MVEAYCRAVMGAIDGADLGESAQPAEWCLSRYPGVVYMSDRPESPWSEATG